MLIHLHLEEIVYVTGVYGKDCTLIKLVETEYECRKAASQMEMIFIARVPLSSSPAGCFRWSGQIEVYFNSITNPLMTSPNPATAGICKGMTI